MSRHRPAAHAAIVMATLVAVALPPVATPASAQPGIPRTSTPSPGAEVYLVPLSRVDGALRVGVPANLTRRDGYDNQPSFSADGSAIYYTSNRGDGQTDIWRYDFGTGLTTSVRRTPESEYSAFPIGDALAVVRVEADSTQRLWRLPLGAGEPTLLVPDIKPVGYFAQANDSTWALFVLGTPTTLQVARTGRPGATVVARDIGRSLHRIPGTSRVSFIQKGGPDWHVMALDPATGRIDTLVRMLPRAEDVAWVDSTTLLAGQGTKLFTWRRGDAGWTELADFGFASLDNITRLAVAGNGRWLAMVADAKPRQPVTARTVQRDTIDAGRVQRAMDVLAGDAMEGRLTGSRGGERAAAWLAEQFREAGLRPAGDDGGYLQHVPLATDDTAALRAGRGRPRAVASWAAFDSLPPDRRLRAANVAGMIPGSDPALRDEVVLVTAHYDHLGYRAPVDGDSVYNGADDDASGTIALVEAARALSTGPRPRRTILFVAVTGEEVGLIGTNWYIRHPIRPLEQTVVNLNVEMIARPDSLSGGLGKAWFTGYERSTMGDLLADNAIPLVPDPRPTQRFFERSDNIAFARRGIPAHTISSFNLHTQYHTPKDEPDRIDALHMAEVIAATARAIRLLGDGLRPEWHPGGRP
jgi:hypothetical protein